MTYLQRMGGVDRERIEKFYHLIEEVKEDLSIPPRVRFTASWDFDGNRTQNPKKSSNERKSRSSTHRELKRHRWSNPRKQTKHKSQQNGRGKIDSDLRKQMNKDRSQKNGKRKIERDQRMIEKFFSPDRGGRRRPLHPSLRSSYRLIRF